MLRDKYLGLLKTMTEIYLDFKSGSTLNELGPCGQDLQWWMEEFDVLLGSIFKNLQMNSVGQKLLVDNKENPIQLMEFYNYSYPDLFK